MTEEGIRRCIRANMTRAATCLENAKDDPARADEWLQKAYRAEALSREWLAELETFKQTRSEP